MIKYARAVVFISLVLANAYVCLLLIKTRHEMNYQKVSYERSIRDINGEWLEHQNIIDRQSRLIKELGENCASTKRGLQEDDLMRWH